MTTVGIPGARSPSGGAGFRHDVGFYGTDGEFKDLIVPFAEAGLNEGEAVVFGYEPRLEALLRSWLPESDAIVYVSDTNAYANPARAIASWRHIVEVQTEKGFPRVRLAGSVPHPGYGLPYAGWDRYEMAADRAWHTMPAWARCLYDTRLAPGEVIERATRLHRHLALPSDSVNSMVGQRPNPAFKQVRSLGEWLVPPLDEIEAGPPVAEFRDPLPVTVRDLVASVARSRIGDALTDDLRLAATEVVANAMVHGRAPVVVRVWAGSDKVAVHVCDQGSGPADPLVGLIPPDRTITSGRGMWIAHHALGDVSFPPSDDGFTVRLFAAQPPL